MDTRTPVSHDIAYLSDLKVTQDGEYVKIANDLDTNLRALDTAIQSGGSGGDVSGKADKVANATEGNFAGLDNTGNLTDSTKSPADFAAADHTHDSLVNGDASLNLASTGAATVTIEGAAPATTATGVVTITAGALSGTGPKGQFSYDLPAATINVPLTLDGVTWKGSTEEDVEVGETSVSVNRPTDTESFGVLAVGPKPAEGAADSLEFITYSIQGDYDNPTLVVDGMSEGRVTFTGTVTYSQVAGPASDVTKTLATTDDVQTAVNTAINALDAEQTSSDGTNVQVKVTETNGKITAVNITSDNTYAKPEGGIPGSDIADGAITASKLAGLHGIVLIDDAEEGTYVGKQYRLSILNGRLSIEEIVEEPTLPTFSKYAIISRDPHQLYDENNEPLYEDGHKWENGYELYCSTDKCLVGLDENDNVTILKKTSGCGKFDFVTTLPPELEHYWDAYYSGDESYEPPKVSIYTIDSEGSEPLPYGCEVNTQGYYDECTYVWGDSNFPSVTMEVVTREQAEAFFNS